MNPSYTNIVGYTIVLGKRDIFWFLKLNNGRPIFKKPGIPKVGVEVSLSASTPLSSLTEVKKQMAKNAFQSFNLGIYIQTPVSQYPFLPYNALRDQLTPHEITFMLTQNSQLRILGYKTYTSGKDQYLFAHVKVLSKGNLPQWCIDSHDNYTKCPLS